MTAGSGSRTEPPAYYEVRSPEGRTLILIVQMSVVLLAGLLLFILAWHRPGWVIFGTIAISALLDLLQIGVDGLHLGMFGINLLIDDAACIVLLGVSFILLRQRRTSFPRDALPCLALLVLSAVSFSRGVTTFRHQDAEESIRGVLIFVMPALAIMLAPPTFRFDTIRLAHWLRCAGLLLGAIALLRWTGVLPIPIELEDPLREVVRTIGAEYAIIVGLAFIAAIYLQLVQRYSAWSWANITALGILTFTLQHRSVWVATAAGSAWFMLRTIRQVRWQTFVAVAGVLGCLMIIAAPRHLMDSAHKMATANIEEVQSENSTWAWRVDGYEEAAVRLFASEPLDILIGPPAGWQENTNASFAAIHIHSQYIDILAYFGVVGLAALLLWFWALARRISWAAKPPYETPAYNHVRTSFLGALLISLMVYFIPYPAYPGGGLQGAILGLIWVAAKDNELSTRVVRIARPSHESDHDKTIAHLSRPREMTTF